MTCLLNFVTSLNSIYLDLIPSDDTFIYPYCIKKNAEGCLW